jgi:hypothetical protein
MDRLHAVQNGTHPHPCTSLPRNDAVPSWTQMEALRNEGGPAIRLRPAGGRTSALTRGERPKQLNMLENSPADLFGG